MVLVVYLPVWVVVLLPVLPLLLVDSMNWINSNRHITVPVIEVTVNVRKVLLLLLLYGKDTVGLSQKVCVANIINLSLFFK